MCASPQFSCLLVGESNLLSRCSEILTERAHTISAVVTQDEGSGSGHNTYRSMAEARAALSTRPDLIFSIVNRTILGPDDITWAKLAAINYHDSPLPSYAGVNAPSWAILNGELEHGVTWHLLADRLDAGDILVQRTFAISGDDTALSLSAKCFEHALSAFRELLDNIEVGNLQGRKQDFSKRTVFSKTRRLPRQGIISWTDSAKDICRFVRASQLGGYANDFGVPKILLPDGSLVVVGKATALPLADSREAGTVVDADFHSAHVVVGDGKVVKVEHLTWLNGRAFAIPPILKDSRLSVISAAEAEAIAVATAYAARLEENMIVSLRDLPVPVRAPLVRPCKYNATGGHVFNREEKHNSSPGQVFAPICERLLLQNDRRPFTVGIAKQVPHGFMPVRPFVCHDAGSSALIAAINQEIAAPAIPADLPARFPELRLSLLRMEAIAICFSVEESVPRTNPGLIVHFHGGRLTLLFDAGQISKEDAGVVADFLFGGNPKAAKPPAEITQLVHQRIAQWAATNPDAVAIESAEENLSYAELEIRSTALASKLHHCGAAKETVIAVLLPQGCNFVMSAVAILKSGAAYLPLEISTPLHRLRDIVCDARPIAVITDENHMDLASQLGATVVPADDCMISGQSTLQTASQTNDLAYVIYTSGSTGEPKGSMIEHGALAAFIAADIEWNKIATDDRVLQLCSTAFDASVEEIFSALCAGATLVVRSPTLLDSADSFLDFCEQKRLTIIGIYSSMLSDVLTAMERRGRFPATVRLATTGGEMVSAADAERWRRFFAERNRQAPNFLNVYGLTETTVANCMSDLSRPPDQLGQVPIGKPLPGNRVRVVDSQLADVALGDVGELLIAGPQLARAYWNRPAINAERFFKDSVDGTRWFRTGDLVRMSPGGELYFEGRVDRQVKVSGVRIELEDIERAMQAHPEIMHAAAILHRFADGRELLVGFFTPVQEGLKQSLRRHLEERLPSAMLPRRLVPIDAFPVNDRGKTDYAALSNALNRIYRSSPRDIFDDTDIVSRVWKELLPWANSKNPEESFFDLGGDSLMAMSLLSRIEQETGARVPVSSFFAKPNIAGLRETLEINGVDKKFSPVIALQPQGNGTPIYFLHGLDGDVGEYFNLARELGPERPIYGVRSPAIFGKEVFPESMERAAEQVLAEIIAQQSEGPCILIGFSWAGILAYETAWQMISTAKFPLILILLDSLAPVRRFGLTERSQHFVRYLPRRTLRLGLKGWLRLFKNVMNFSEPEPRSTTVERHFSDLVLQYGAPQVPWLDIHLIRMDEAVWRKKVGPLSEVSLLWRDYGWHRISTGKVYVYQVRCQEHSDMLREPNCKDVAGLIRKVASTLESPNP